MRLHHRLAFSACLLLAAPNVVYARTQSPADDAFAAVKGWAAAINRNNVNDIVSRYASDVRKADYTIPLFLGTKSPSLATTKEEVKHYFEDFVKEKPTVVLCKEHEPIKLSKTAVLFAGFYNFTLNGELTRARYSFLMLKLNGVWRIAHHHSSVRPDGDTKCTPLQ